MDQSILILLVGWLGSRSSMPCHWPYFGSRWLLTLLRRMWRVEAIRADMVVIASPLVDTGSIIPWSADFTEAASRSQRVAHCSSLHLLQLSQGALSYTMVTLMAQWAENTRPSGPLTQDCCGLQLWVYDVPPQPSVEVRQLPEQPVIVEPSLPPLAHGLPHSEHHICYLLLVCLVRCGYSQVC